MTTDADKALSGLKFNNYRDLKTSYFSLHTFTIACKRSEHWHIQLICIHVLSELNVIPDIPYMLAYIPCQRNTNTLVITSTFTHDQVIFMTVWWCNLWNVLTNITYRDCQNNSIQRQYFFILLPYYMYYIKYFRRFYDVCVAF